MKTTVVQHLHTILVALTAARRDGAIDQPNAVFIESAVWDAARKADVYGALSSAVAELPSDGR